MSHDMNIKLGYHRFLEVANDGENREMAFVRYNGMIVGQNLTIVVEVGRMTYKEDKVKPLNGTMYYLVADYFKEEGKTFECLLTRRGDLSAKFNIVDYSPLEIKIKNMFRRE
jgi:hypothetical protein